MQLYAGLTGLNRNVDHTAVNDVQRAFAATLERALLEKARTLAASGAESSGY